MEVLSRVARAGVRHLPVRIAVDEPPRPLWLEGRRLEDLAVSEVPKTYYFAAGRWLRHFHRMSALFPPANYKRQKLIDDYMAALSRHPSLGARPSILTFSWLHSDLHPGNCLVINGGSDGGFGGAIDWEYMRFGWSLFDVADAMWRVCERGSVAEDAVLRYGDFSALFLEGYGLTEAEGKFLLPALDVLLEFRGAFLRSAIQNGGLQFSDALDGVEAMRVRLRSAARGALEDLVTAVSLGRIGHDKE